MIDQLRALVPKALGVRLREIDEGDEPLVAALHVLKASALYGRAYSIGSPDPEELETRSARTRRQPDSTHFARAY